VFLEVETTRRAFLLSAVQTRNSSSNLHAFPSPGEDYITFDDYCLIFIRGVFRELLTQLAVKLKEVMQASLKKGVYLNMNRHLNNY
jgi:hypothetical protein